MNTKCIAFQKTVSAALAVLMLLGLFVLLPGAAAHAEDAPPADIVVNAAESAPTEQQPAGGGGLYVAGYSVVDAAGNAITTLTPGTKCKIVLMMVDGRIKDSDVPPDTSLKSYIHITPSSKAFSTVSDGDIWLDRQASVNGWLTYTITFNDISYADTTGNSKTLSFDVSAINNTAPGAPVALAGVPLTSISQEIGQCGLSGDGTSVSSAKPSVMVKEASYGGENIAAGQTFTLNITAYNTSKTSAITDVRTTINLQDKLTLAAGSNVVLTDSVAAGGSYTTTFTLQAQSNAETGPVNLNVQFDYYVQGTGEQMSSSQTIVIPVVQPDRFSFTTLDMPQEAFTGEEITLTLNYVNKGKGVLYNLSAEISGNIANPGQQQYLGNLNSGTEGSVDFIVSTLEAGTLSGTITITYEDVNGKQQIQTKDYSLTVSEAPVYEDPMAGMNDPAMDAMDMQQPGLPVWGWALIAAAVVLAGIVAAVIIVKKKKAKRRAALLAEDDDDEDF